MIESMNFIHPVIVAGRTVTGLGSDYHAELIEFPWVKVWAKDDPSRPRLTTIFNVRDCEAGAVPAPVTVTVTRIDREGGEAWLDAKEGLIEGINRIQRARKPRKPG